MSGILNFSQWANPVVLNENIQRAKAELIKRYAEKHRIEEITPEIEQKATEDRAYNKIREIVKNNDGYVYAFLLFWLDHEASFNDLEELYARIKDNAGSLNSLPMTIEEYSKQDKVNGVDSLEALGDQFHKMEERRKYRWIIDKVNGDLRRSIKSMSPENIDRLYTAAKLIDKADEEAGDFTDPDTGIKTNNRRSLLFKSNAFKDGLTYLDWVEKMADGVSNSEISSKIALLRSLQPEAGILYNSNGYLAMSIRTEHAQKELCSIANWCINRGRWGIYGGEKDALQFNIFNFNLPVTHPLHLTGTTIKDTTIHGDGRVTDAHDKNDDVILKSADPTTHFTKLGYPSDLVDIVVSTIPRETTIKTIVTGLNINSSTPFNLLLSLVKSTYTVNLDVEADVRQIVLEIVKDQLSKKLSRGEVFDLFIKYGVLSTFSAKMLNVLIPTLSDNEKDELLKVTNKIINDPVNGFRAIIARFGRSKYPQLTAILDAENEVKDIVLNGNSTLD